MQRRVIVTAGVALAMAAGTFFLFYSMRGLESRQTEARPLNEVYVFPIQPGTAKWASFQSHQEMLAATQIPENVLANLSTTALVDTVLSYPLLIDISAYDYRQDGIDMMTSQFNGMAELIQREDAGTVLATKYEGIDPLAIDPAWGLVDQGHYMSRIATVELLLSQQVVLATMSTQERTQLLGKAGENFEAMATLPELYGLSSLISTSGVMGRILVVEQDEDFEQTAKNDPIITDFLLKVSFPGNLSSDTIAKKIMQIFDHALQHSSAQGF